MNRAELKSKAKAQIKGKIGILFVITLVIVLVTYAVTFLFSTIITTALTLASSGENMMLAAVIELLSALAVSIITPAFGLSMVSIYLMVVNGGMPEVKDAFCGFKDFWSAFKLTFLVGLYTFLWSLLFYIPGIVKALSYSMSMYILAENPGKSARECIKESVEMTNGHKCDLFVLGLSFIGWFLLSYITLGIALIWVAPYMYATYANAYYSLKPVAEVSKEPEMLGEPEISENFAE